MANILPTMPDLPTPYMKIFFESTNQFTDLLDNALIKISQIFKIAHYVVEGIG